MSWMPCLHDSYEEAGIIKNEYFWQDLLVARWIHDAKPLKHVDIGSRVDGFVTHVASFREIEVFDIRPLSSPIPGVVFRQADLMNAVMVPSDAAEGYCDSLSCLHALEHFGLGRYGDPLDPVGWRRGFENMVKLLKPSGIFYLSVPLGRERVEFNAHFVFDPRTILNCAKTNRLELKRLVIFNPNRGFCESEVDEGTLNRLAQQDYNLGIFIFKKSGG